MNGDLMPIKFRQLSDTELDAYVSEILSKQQREKLAAGNDIDFSYVAEEGGRFRVNVFRKVTGVGAVFRHIPGEVPTLEQLNVPAILTDFCDFHQGMVLVTGSTGTGKSTTLAAMVNHINASRELNIISLEDPIEFVHPSKKSQLIQREVGTHVRSFADGVRSAMREDPDVILVGELRDADTIMMAMTAAETGHLVLGTLHTTSAVKTLDRIVDALPGELREQTKAFLAMSLKAVCTQVLCKTPDGRGRRAVLEILINNRAIANLITGDQTHQIPSQLQTGKDLGMQLMDQALLDAIQKKEVDPDDAFRFASDKKKFQRYVTNTDLVAELRLSSAAEK